MYLHKGSTYPMKNKTLSFYFDILPPPIDLKLAVANAMTHFKSLKEKISHC